MEACAKTAEWSNVLKLWAVVEKNLEVLIIDESGRKVMKLREEQARLVKWSVTGSFLAVASVNGNLTVFKITKYTWKAEPVLRKSLAPISLSWDGDHLITVLADKRIEKIDVKSGESNSFSFEFQPRLVCSHGSVLTVVSDEGEITTLSDNETSHVTRVLSPVHFLGSCGSHIYVIYSDNLLLRFDAKNPSENRVWLKLEDGNLSGVCVNEEMLCYAIGNTIYRRITLNEDPSLLRLSSDESNIVSFSFCPLTNVLVSVFESGMIAIWRLGTKVSLLKCVRISHSFTQAYVTNTGSSVLLVGNEYHAQIVSMPVLSGQVVLTSPVSLATKAGESLSLTIEAKCIRYTLGYTIVGLSGRICVLDRQFQVVTEIKQGFDFLEAFGEKIVCACGNKILVFNISGASLDEKQISSDIILGMSLNGIALVILGSDYCLSLFRVLRNGIVHVRNVLLANKYFTCNSIGVSRDGNFVSISFEFLGKSQVIIINTQNSKSICLPHGRVCWDLYCASLFCVECDGLFRVYAIDQTLKYHVIWKFSAGPSSFLQSLEIPRVLATTYGSSYESCVTSLVINPLYDLDGLDSSEKSSLAQVFVAFKFGQDVQTVLDGIEDSKVVEKAKLFLQSLKGSYEASPSRCLHSQGLKGIVSSPQSSIFLGRLNESKGKFEEALQHFTCAKDTTEKVRLLCLMSRFDKIDSILSDSSDIASICVYARFLARIGEAEQNPELISKAIDLYVRVKQYHSAFILAFEKQLTESVISLAPFVSPSLLCKAAIEYEKVGDVNTASHLYFHAGMADKALEIALDASNSEVIDTIIDNSTQKLDERIAKRCLEFYVKNNDFQRQAQLFVLSGSLSKAMELCCAQELSLSQKLLSRLQEIGSVDAAHLLHQQREYRMAAKVYDQLHMFSDELEELILAKDVTKVIECAEKAKIPQLYETAGHFLASTLPRFNSIAFNATVDFFSKSESFESLFSFLDERACAAIANNSDYYKATKILTKLKECITIYSTGRDYERRMKSVMERIRFIEMYNEAVLSSPDRMMSLCHSLLMTKSAAETVNMSDVKMIIVRRKIEEQDYLSAYRLLEEIMASGTDLKKYMDLDTIRRIFIKAGARYFECDDDLSDGPEELHEPKRLPTDRYAIDRLSPSNW